MTKQRHDRQNSLDFETPVVAVTQPTIPPVQPDIFTFHKISWLNNEDYRALIKTAREDVLAFIESNGQINDGTEILSTYMLPAQYENHGIRTDAANKVWVKMRVVESRGAHYHHVYMDLLGREHFLECIEMGL